MFEEQQNFRVEVYDVDNATNLNDLTLHDYIGGHTFTLGKVVSGRDQTLTVKIDGPKAKADSKVSIHGIEKKSNYGAIEASFEIDCDFKNSGSIFITINKFKK